MSKELTAVPWAQSDAKVMLTQAILEGTVTENSNLVELHASCNEYMEYEVARFKANCKNLIVALNSKEGRARFDSNAVAHDRALFPRAALTLRGIPFWDTSRAKVLLVADIDAKFDKGKTPKELWNERDEYKEFPLEVFRKHIDQERSKRKQSAFRQYKSQNKKK